MLKVYTDGAARGNKGPAASGFVVFKKDKLIEKKAFYIGISTNNTAEYRAIIKALSWAPENQKIKIYSDSKLIINQINGNYKVKAKHLKKLHRKVKELSSKLNVKFRWVPRDTPGIVIADNLINKELDKQAK